MKRRIVALLMATYDGEHHRMHYRMRKQQQEATSDKAGKTEKEADTEPIKMRTKSSR